MEWLECEVLAGLERFAHRELRAALSGRVDVGEGRVRLVAERVPLRLVNGLRSVVAAYLGLHFAVARPRALLGHEHLTRLARTCERVLRAWPSESFRTLHVSAAGGDSAVMTRIKADLAELLGLEISEAAGDLAVRIRRADEGWQVLVRTSPRPLSTRAWRVCNLPGALNATVAHAMVQLSEPLESEVFVNIGCGSGTLLIERLGVGHVGAALGYDLDPTALDCARKNADASGFGSAIQVAECDARSLPLETGSVRTLVADLPYAMLLGTGEANASLYPDLLTEAARVVLPGGRAVVITTQNRLMRGVLERLSDRWQPAVTVGVKIPARGGYITPNIYSLVRRHRV